MSENILEILVDEENVSRTSYSIAEIWEKRNYLSGSANHVSHPDRFINIFRDDNTDGKLIYNTGFTSPAVEVRPSVKERETVHMLHNYFTHVTSVHDYEDLLKRYYAKLYAGGSDGLSTKAYDLLKEWSLSNYDKLVTDYTKVCEYGLCQALTNVNGYVIPSKENQEPDKYNPNINHSSTSATLSSFDTVDPSFKLLQDLVLLAQKDGYSPDVILVGDAIASAIMNSSWYNTHSRTAPVTNVFSFTPRESNNTIVARGAIELVGIYAGGCKIIWINSQIEGASAFKPNCAIALDSSNFASIYSGPMYTNNGINNDIIRFTTAPEKNEKEIRWMLEYCYLPVINHPDQVYRIYYS